MSDSREMEEMVVGAPAGSGEAHVAVLCVEATAAAQAALEKAVQPSSSSSAAAAAAALLAVRKLGGTRLRVSPYTTVHVLRGFLAAEAGEAAATAQARGTVATAQFFAMRPPAAAAAAGAAEVSAGSEAGDAAEALVALPDSATLQEVLSCAGALQLPAEADAADGEPTLVLLYAHESHYGDLIEQCIDACIFGFCAAIGAYLAHMCIRKTTETVNKQRQAKKEKKEQKEQEMQQQQQQQGPPQNYDPSQQPPPPPGYAPYYGAGSPSEPQPYYQGPGGPNSYGAPPPPPPPPMPPMQQQQPPTPANGYIVNQPSGVSYNPVPPPQARVEPTCAPPSPPPPAPPAAAASSTSPLSASAHAGSPHGLPPALYPSSINEDRADEDAKANALRRTSDFENPSCHPEKTVDMPPDEDVQKKKEGDSGDARAGLGFTSAQPQYGSSPRAGDDAPGWSWSPINTAGDEAVWTPASGQADGPSDDKRGHKMI